MAYLFVFSIPPLILAGRVQGGAGDGWILCPYSLVDWMVSRKEN